MNNKKMLVSLGAAIASSKFVKSFSEISFEDVLSAVGLVRKRNHTIGNVALVGAGAMLGAGLALVLAPRN